MASDLTGAMLGNAHYRIDIKLGSGGQGTVYRGTHLTLNIPVAIKVLPFSRDEAMRKRFAREAQRAAALRHANIVGVLDYAYDSDLDTYYIVSEFIAGGDLKKLRESRGGPLPAAEVAGFAKQVAAALQYAHDQNIIHRDIKPSNILLEERTGRVVLCDFGLARMIEGEDLNVTSVASGVTPGTPAYMSPEQCIGGELDHRSDLYSLGVVLYELLTGVNPFREGNDTSDSIRYKHLHQTPPPARQLNPAISPAVEAVLLKALAKDPGQRYQSATELAAALEQAVQTRSGPGLAKIAPWIGAGVGAVVLVLAVGALAGFGPLARKDGGATPTPAGPTSVPVVQTVAQPPGSATTQLPATVPASPVPPTAEPTATPTKSEPTATPQVTARPTRRPTATLAPIR